MLETGFQIDSLHRAQSFTTYESHVLFALRFMIDCSISGGNWVELKAGGYKLLGSDDSRKQSHCQLEVHVNYKDLISHPAEGELFRVQVMSDQMSVYGWKGQAADCLSPELHKPISLAFLAGSQVGVRDL